MSRLLETFSLLLPLLHVHVSKFICIFEKYFTALQDPQEGFRDSKLTFMQPERHTGALTYLRHARGQCHSSTSAVLFLYLIRIFILVFQCKHSLQPLVAPHPYGVELNLNVWCSLQKERKRFFLCSCLCQALVY